MFRSLVAWLMFRFFDVTPNELDANREDLIRYRRENDRLRVHLNIARAHLADHVCSCVRPTLPAIVAAKDLGLADEDP